MSNEQPGVARRIGSAIVASAAGLIVGAPAAAVLGAIVELFRHSFRSVEALVWSEIAFFTAHSDSLWFFWFLS